MTQIDIERKPARSIWPWLAALLLVVIAAWGIFTYVQDQNEPDTAELPAQTAPAPAERMDTTSQFPQP